MAKPSIDQVVWIFNRGTGLVEIVEDGKILETCKLGDAPSRLAYHRTQAAKASGATFVETRARRQRVKEQW